LGQIELFPPQLLLGLDERVKRSCESSLIIQSIKPSKDKEQKKPWGQNGNSRSWGRSVPVLENPVSTYPVIEQIPSPSSPTVIPQTPEPVTQNIENSDSHSDEKRIAECSNMEMPKWAMPSLLIETMEKLKEIQRNADAQKTEVVGGRLKFFGRSGDQKAHPKEFTIGSEKGTSFHLAMPKNGKRTNYYKGNAHSFSDQNTPRTLKNKKPLTK
jgi:hypothetical protein